MISWSLSFSLLEPGLHPVRHTFLCMTSRKMCPSAACHALINHLPRRQIHREDWLNVTFTMGTTGTAKLFKGRILACLTSTFQNEQLQMPFRILILSLLSAGRRLRAETVSVYSACLQIPLARHITFGQTDKKKKIEQLLSIKNI